MRWTRGLRPLASVGAAIIALAGSGCMGHEQFHVVPEPAAALLAPPPGVPTELNMISLPPYAIGSPDILVIDVYTQPREALGEAVRLSPQPITGQHLVRPDGTVKLGVYGAVSVAGLTTEQAQEAIRRHVYEQLKVLHATSNGRTTPPPDDPAKLYVVVDVAAYNSKLYFVITDGAGFGEQIYSFPLQGHETVLSALANINGLPPVGSKRHVWVARRTPHCNQPEQILPVDYVGVTQHACTATNYQLLPGDRVYVRAEKEFKIDGYLQKVLTPIERVLGITLLGSSTYNSITNRRQTGGGF
jgi:polysaccharide export outer membrane protein